MSRGREIEAPSDGFSDDRPTHHVEQQLEVACAAGQRTLHRHHDGRIREVGEREGAGRRDRGLRRAMPVDAAVGGGHADRSADVAADLERGHAGSKGGRAATRAAARSASQIPRVVRAPVDLAVRLPVGDCFRDVRLAEQARPRVEDSAGNRAVVRRPVVTREVGSRRTAGRPAT